MKRAFPWLLSVALFFVAVRDVITWAWLPWMLVAVLVITLGVMINGLSGMFRR